MTRVEGKIISETGYSNRTIPDAITGLVKKGLLIRTQVRRVLFISPAYFMKGDYKKIYSLAELVRKKDKFIMEQVEHYEHLERTIYEENSLEKIWDKKREEQFDIEKQIEKLTQMEREVQ